VDSDAAARKATTAKVPLQRSPDRRDYQGAHGRLESRRPSRKNGVSDATLYAWRSKYGGPAIGDLLMRLKQLEEENRRLKKIVAGQAVNIEALKIVAEGNF